MVESAQCRAARVPFPEDVSRRDRAHASRVRSSVPAPAPGARTHRPASPSHPAPAGISTASIILSCGLSLGLDRSTAFRLVLSACTGAGLLHGLRDLIRYASEAAHYDRERKREAWELANYREGEEAEMVELYVERGVSRFDASTAITALARHTDFFVDLMMTQELGLATPDADARVAGFASALAFLAASLLPMRMLQGYMEWAGMEAGALMTFPYTPGGHTLGMLHAAVTHPVLVGVALVCAVFSFFSAALVGGPALLASLLPPSLLTTHLSTLKLGFTPRPWVLALAPAVLAVAAVSFLLAARVPA